MASKEKKGAKIGRSARRPSTAAYKMTMRAQKNKRRRIEANAAFKVFCQTKTMKTPRGTARRLARIGVQRAV